MNCRNSLKIGFKYCGGCNPRYDRKAVYKEFQLKGNGQLNISLARDYEKYDYLIVLAGCLNDCEDCSKLIYEQEKIVITEDSKVDDIIKCITIL